MKNPDYDVISQGVLQGRLSKESPENGDRENGYTLVNVLSKDQFEKEHIPSSINIPKGNEDEFEKRFSKDKEIVVYCASPQCTASADVAQELVKRGFGKVYDYEDGMSKWKDAGGKVEQAAAA